MKLVKTEDHGAVRLLTLNRPAEMNAYNAALHSALLAAVDAADNDNSVRAIVVTGEGRAFCAGADFREGFNSENFQKIQEQRLGIDRDLGGILNIRIYESDTPIIAAVNGAAVGIGATMLLPMDIRIAANTAKFSFPFSRRGIVFDGAASWFLPRVVGWAKASDWAISGRMISAEEALAAGFIGDLAAPDRVLDMAMKRAQDIAQNCSPQSVAWNKQLLRESMLGNGPMAAHMGESTALQRAFKSPDCAEGVAAFLQKRAPNFQGR